MSLNAVSYWNSSSGLSSGVRIIKSSSNLKSHRVVLGISLSPRNQVQYGTSQCAALLFHTRVHTLQYGKCFLSVLQRKKKKEKKRKSSDLTLANESTRIPSMQKGYCTRALNRIRGNDVPG